MPTSEVHNQSSKFLYHLGKALWQSVPVIGPLVNELIYEQFSETLLGKMNALSENDLRKIESLIPNGMTPDQIENLLSTISRDINKFTSEYWSSLLTNFHHLEKTSTESKAIAQENSRTLLEIQKAISVLNTNTPDTSIILQALEIIENKRQTWIERISSNQLLFLKHIPDDYISIDKLWSMCYTLIPACGYKEFRFRLHELEWLGLIERIWKNNEVLKTWLYKRTISGNKRALKK